jgi:5-methylcytosine-specific restriction endonuclease McrA
VSTIICTRCNIEKGSNSDNFELRSNGKYRNQCRGCVSERRAQYYLKNKDDIKSKTSSYAQSHKNETATYKKKWITNNPEKRKEVNRISELKRRAAKKNVTVNKFTISDIVSTYGDRCFYCGGKFEHVDHYVPLSKGGPHSLENVRPSCKNCNLRKHSKMPEDFKRQVNFG